jgi:hypothetical protein
MPDITCPGESFALVWFALVRFAPVDGRFEERVTGVAIATLLPLPSHSPQLDPIENIWAYLRGNVLNRRVWDSYDEIVEACCTAWNCTAWNAFINDIGRVRGR